MGSIPTLIYGNLKSILGQTTCTLEGVFGKFCVKRQEATTPSPMERAKANSSVGTVEQNNKTKINQAIQSSLEIIKSVHSQSEKILEQEKPSQKQLKDFKKDLQYQKDQLQQQLELIKNAINKDSPQAGKINQSLVLLSSITTINQFNSALLQVEIQLKAISDEMSTIVPGAHHPILPHAKHDTHQDLPESPSA
jgi:soluble cytochrome b562